ncbi:hypothetical protein [Methylosinus sp. LW4]|uniref:hypothetical protein n=1 Tax=Methylosinus sp. LW4 TaxID=136993 RepID=UPI00037044B0|nr:hypothetical protein [Methylosinus sp. LW4]
MKFPENIDYLHGGEEFIRSRSKAAIQASELLLHHFNMVADSMNLIHYFVHACPRTDNDQLTIKLLGIRLFNSCAGAVQNSMSGYYQNAVMQLRDILEITFLLDYFRLEKALISEWRSCSESERNKRFSAFKVRTTLDDRDGFTTRKRMEHYQLLCNLGAHASFQGFELLRPNAGGDAQCGPYFADRAIDATISEMAKVSVGAAGIFMTFFDMRNLSDYETKLQFMEAQSAWFERFFGHSLDLGQIDHLRRLLEQARAAFK